MFCVWERIFQVRIIQIIPINVSNLKSSIISEKSNMWLTTLQAKVKASSIAKSCSHIFFSTSSFCRSLKQSTECVESEKTHFDSFVFLVETFPSWCQTDISVRRKPHWQTHSNGWLLRASCRFHGSIILPVSNVFVHSFYSS